ERRAGRRTEAGDRNSVPGRNPELAGEFESARSHNRVFVAGYGQHGGNGDPPGCNRRRGQFAGDGAPPANTPGKTQTALLPYAPPINETTLLDSFAHRGAAKYYGLGH